MPKHIETAVLFNKMKSDKLVVCIVASFHYLTQFLTQFKCYLFQQHSYNYILVIIIFIFKTKEYKIE